MARQVDPTGSLHPESKPGQFWSTTNLGEALPGVASPLGWSIWGKASGVPSQCVVGNGNGTKLLKTGDYVRVDGNGGTVTLLKRAESEN